MGVEEQQEVSFQMGMQSDSASVEHSLTAAYKTKQALARTQQALSSAPAQRTGKDLYDVSEQQL